MSRTPMLNWFNLFDEQAHKISRSLFPTPTEKQIKDTIRQRAKAMSVQVDVTVAPTAVFVVAKRKVQT